MTTKLNLTIEPQKGMDCLTFGMTIDDVVKILGNASIQDDNQDEDGFSYIELSYDDYDMSLFFEGDGSPSYLSDIEIENPETTIFGVKIFELNKKQVIDLMKKNGYDDADVNLDEELQEECVSYDNEIIDFYFDNDKLVSVNFGVILSPNGEIIK